MYHKETDFVFSGFLKLERWYNSNSPGSGEGSGELGQQWTYTYCTAIVVESPQNRVRIETPTGSIRYYTLYSGAYYPYAGTQGDLVVSGGGYTETLYDGIINQFDSNGRLIRVENATGNYITIEYYQLDESSQPLNTIVTDEFGRNVVLHHDTSGRVDWATDPVGRTYSYTYDETAGDGNGNLLSVAYPDGTAHNYSYEQTAFPHKLTAIIVASGGSETTVAAWRYEETDQDYYRWANFSSDGQVNGEDINPVSFAFGNNTTVVTDSLGRDTTYISSNLNGTYKTTELTGNCGCSKGRTGYDAYGNLSWRDDEKGNRTVYSDYDKTSPRTVFEAYSTAYESVTHYTYHPATGNVASVKRTSAVPFDNYTTSLLEYRYDGFNNMTGTSASGNTRNVDGGNVHSTYESHYRYNWRGDLTNSVDPRGNTTVFGYYSTTWGDHEHGRLHTVTNALNQTTTYSDYSSGKPRNVVDANGIQTSNVYDSRGRLTAVTVHQRTTIYGYDMFSNMTSMRLPRGNRVGYGYDAANRMVRVSDSEGNYIKYEYDTESNRTREETRDSSNTLVKYRDMAYDDDKRLRSTKLFGMYTTTMTYDLNGNLAASTDYNRNTTSYDYDPLDRLRRVTQPAPETGFGNISTVYTYDTNDNITSVKDGRGNVTLYVYDDFSRLVETVSPDTGMTRYEYDAAGNMTKKKDAAGTLIIYDYDELNRLTFIDYPGTGQDVTYTYDETATGYYNIGRMTTMTDASGTTSYFYDAYGELVKEVKTFADLPGQSFTTEYSYNANGDLEKITYPDGRLIQYNYNSATSKLKSVQTSKDGVTKMLATNIMFKPFGPLASYTLGNGLTAYRVYDKDYRLISLKSGPMLKRRYQYDKNGNITYILDAVHLEKSQSFTYDALNRLRTASGEYGFIEYDYDAVGNLTTKTVNGNETALDYVDGTNRLDAPYTYDDDGNITSDGALEFEYDVSGSPEPGCGLVFSFTPQLNLYTYTPGNPLKYMVLSRLVWVTVKV